MAYSSLALRLSSHPSRRRVSTKRSYTDLERLAPEEYDRLVVEGLLKTRSLEGSASRS